jgi:thiamine biosynthesis lipoprotein
MILALKRLVSTKFFFSTAFVLIGAATWLFTPRMVHVQGPVFGTTYKVVVVAPKVSLTNASLNALIEHELARLNAIYSSYLPSSELSQFNRHRHSEPFEVSAELHAFFTQSKQWHARLNGAWDPTLGPLSRAYGLQPTMNDTPQSPADISVGFEFITVMPNLRIKKQYPTLEVDFSSNAKGHAVDQLITLIRKKRGIKGVFVDIGGEIRTLGHKGNGAPWRVGIQHPVIGNGPLMIVAGNHLVVASSGNYLNRANTVGHILDPRTKGPVTHHLVAVTVMASTCRDADTLATGLFVMGHDDASNWLKNHPEFPALLVTKRPDGDILTHPLNGFMAHVQD